MLFGDFLLLWMRYKNRIAQGAALEMPLMRWGLREQDNAMS
jgi:hypothetical protein